MYYIFINVISHTNNILYRMENKPCKEPTNYYTPHIQDIQNHTDTKPNTTQEQ